MYGSTLIHGVCLNFFIQKIHTSAIDPSDGEDKEVRKRADAMNPAKWTASATLSAVLIAQTIIALLNASLDIPRSLKVSNRYLRMFPRAIVVVVVCCPLIDKAMDAITYLAILKALLIPCLIWNGSLA